MAEEIIQSLKLGGLECAMNKTEWMANQWVIDGSGYVLKVGGDKCKDVADAGMAVLGTVLTVDGKTHNEFDSRCAKAWGKCHSLKLLLLRRTVPLAARVRLLNVTVSKSVLWGCQSWRLTQRQEQRLKSIQLEMIRRMMGLGRKPGELWAPFYQRGMRAARTFLKQSGFLSWYQSWLLLLHRWAGHVARMDDNRLTKQVLKFRSLQWWRQEQGKGFQHLRHPARYREWRWEARIFNFYSRSGRSWLQDAINRESWKLDESVFANAAADSTADVHIWSLELVRDTNNQRNL
eukprot:TRINITY_DN9374_c0_g1_i1.p1 TRINITY_DN9374_c0_g1~~TRINITY_DN9374_c0_g1_i1.p1  ORF type:complete len:326 (+),score=26.19 TRINITY_DN9374_c0_g1_i1:110-979(+)